MKQKNSVVYITSGDPNHFKAPLLHLGIRYSLKLLQDDSG